MHLQSFIHFEPVDWSFQAEGWLQVFHCSRMWWLVCQLWYSYIFWCCLLKMILSPLDDHSWHLLVYCKFLYRYVCWGQSKMCISFVQLSNKLSFFPCDPYHGCGSHLSVTVIINHMELASKPINEVCAGFQVRFQIWYAECPLSKMNGFLLEMGMSSILLSVPSGSRKFLVLSILFD